MIRGQKYKMTYKFGNDMVSSFTGYYTGIIEQRRDCPAYFMFNTNFIHLNEKRFDAGLDYPIEITDIIKIEKVKSGVSTPIITQLKGIERIDITFNISHSE